jgi:hypothetical protein
VNDTTGSTHCYGPKTEDGSPRKEFLKLPGAAKIIGQARYTVSGEMLIGSTAETANGGQLNPAHSRWLMGYRQAWDAASPLWAEWLAATALSGSEATETPSLQTSPPSSSAPLSGRAQAHDCHA